MDGGRICRRQRERGDRAERGATAGWLVRGGVGHRSARRSEELPARRRLGHGQERTGLQEGARVRRGRRSARRPLRVDEHERTAPRGSSSSTQGADAPVELVLAKLPVELDIGDCSPDAALKRVGHGVVAALVTATCGDAKERHQFVAVGRVDPVGRGRGSPAPGGSADGDGQGPAVARGERDGPRQRRPRGPRLDGPASRAGARGASRRRSCCGTARLATRGILPSRRLRSASSGRPCSREPWRRSRTRARALAGR
jgi:hypothetical protein